MVGHFNAHKSQCVSPLRVLVRTLELHHFLLRSPAPQVRLQDDFDDLLDNMDAEFQAAAPAARAGQPLTASQQAAADMDEFERQLAMGELDDTNIGGGNGTVAASDGTADETAAPVLTASQQAAAEMDEFERQLAFGDDPPAAGSGSGAAAPGNLATIAAAEIAVPVMTASQQVAAEMDDFERRLALGDDPPAAEDKEDTGAGPQTAPPAVTASQQAAAEMDDFERRLALGDDASPAAAGPAPATAIQRAADGANQQAGNEMPTADEGTAAVIDSQQAAAKADEPVRQLANGEAQSAGRILPCVPSAASQQPVADEHAVQWQLTGGECAPLSAAPPVSAAVASADKLALHAMEGELAPDAGSPAAKRARRPADGGAQSARQATDGSSHPLAQDDPVQRGSQHASRAVDSGLNRDAGSVAHDGPAALEDDHADEDDDMDLADMDDEELLRLVMTQAEDEARRE